MTQKTFKPQGPEGIAYDKATLIKAQDTPRFLWGDEKARYVSDWIYGSSSKIHMMSFEMTVGSRFGNSPDFKTYYNCAETYHCLKGEFTFHCPETGEVHVLRKGDTLYFPPNTWHWGYNFGSETSHILECLTPRTLEAVEAYAAKQPWLETIKLSQRDALGPFPPVKPADKQRATLVRPGDYVYEIVGETRPMRVGLVCANKKLTVGVIDLYAGQECDFVSHKGDKVLYNLEGRSNIYLPDETPNWWELNVGDTAFIPGGTRHAFFNTSDDLAKVLFGVAPDYA